MQQSGMFQQAREFPTNPDLESPGSSATLFLPSAIKLCNPPQPLHLMICLTSCVTLRLVPREKIRQLQKARFSSMLCLCFPPFSFVLSSPLEVKRCTDMIKKESNLLCWWSFIWSFVCVCVWVFGCSHTRMTLTYTCTLRLLYYVSV